MYYADRYCPDGRYDLYDFRSENERRRTDALELALQGKLHDRRASATRCRWACCTARCATASSSRPTTTWARATCWARALTPADPALTDENTNRDERSTELYARDAIALSP